MFLNERYTLDQRNASGIKTIYTEFRSSISDHFVCGTFIQQNWKVLMEKLLHREWSET